MDWTNQDQWSNRSKAPRMGDKVELLKLTNKWTTVRMIGKSVTLYHHWFKVTNKEGKPTRFSKQCLGMYTADDGSTQIDASKCPYCTICESQPSPEVWSNVISRSEQEAEPRRKGQPTRYEKKKRKLSEGVGFFKEDKDTEAWTPVRGMRATTSLGKKISEIASLNTRKTDAGKKAFGPDHSKFGFDLMIKFDENAGSPNDMYSAQKGERTRLTEDELEYLRWHFPIEVTESEAEATKEAKNIKPRLLDAKNQPLFPDLARDSDGKKKKKKGDHGKYRDQFDDDDDEDIEDDDDRKRRKKSKSKKSSRSRDDDDDDADDDDDEFDDDVDGADDDDEDDDDGDDRRRKSSKASKSKSKKSARRARDEDDDDDDEEDEDDDSDDDEEEDEDDDDDAEEERRRRKKKARLKASAKSSKKNGKSNGKRRSRDDDDDDDEIPF